MADASASKTGGDATYGDGAARPRVRQLPVIIAELLPLPNPCQRARVWVQGMLIWAMHDDQVA